MRKFILILVLNFIGLILSASVSGNVVVSEGDKDGPVGNLIIQTIPSQVKVEIPRLKVDDKKKQEFLTFQGIETGEYDLSFKSGNKIFACSVKVLDYQTVHLMVNIEEKTVDVKVISTKPKVTVSVPATSAAAPAQTASAASPQAATSGVMADDVYVTAEQMPEFPGGTAELQKWISKNVRYPAVAHSNGITGKVYVSCVINKEGKVENVKVLRSVDKLLDKEAVRVIKAMPAWKPGMNNGELIKVSYNFPINFQIRS